MSTRGRKRPPPMTPEESRLLDGVLSASEAKRLENVIASDPERTDALDTYREAMAVWRDDSTRLDVDPDSMADRVLAAVGATQGGGQATLPTWYAVAAMLLIGIGVIGTAAVQGSRTARSRAPSANVPSITDALIHSIATDRALPASGSLPEGK